MRMDGVVMTVVLTSAAFQNGGEIPAKYTCSGADISPALNWSGIPDKARSIAFIADDPDAPRGTWTHWVLWNMPPHASHLPEGVPGDPQLANGARQGRNDFGRNGYGGPCPPPGKPHRYFFRLYALDTLLELNAGSTRTDVESAMRGHVLAEATWMGTFHR